jgi:hypothetical protein
MATLSTRWFARWAFVRLLVFVACVLLSFSGCDGTPTRPDGNRDPQGRTGNRSVTINCGETGASPLVCRATARCWGLYSYCPDFTTGDDVTARVPWYSETESIADATESGVFVAGSPGDTVAGVRTSGISSGEPVTVSVFADGAIFRTLDISGSTYETGTQSAISGALVEILDGRAAGRTALSGAPRPPGALAGRCSGSGSSSGRYCLYGVPPGRYRLRASASGFVSQETEVVLTSEGDPRQVHFAMPPQ